MEEDLAQKYEEEPRAETSSDESGGEFTISGFTKWRELRIANAADHYVWVGIEHDKKYSKWYQHRGHSKEKEGESSSKTSKE